MIHLRFRSSEIQLMQTVTNGLRLPVYEAFCKLCLFPIKVRLEGNPPFSAFPLRAVSGVDHAKQHKSKARCGVECVHALMYKFSEAPLLEQETASRGGLTRAYV